MEDRSRRNTKYWITIVLLIIIILLLLFFIRFGRIQYSLVPTGNVDVFDIDIRCNCSGKDDCVTTDGDGKEGVIASFNEDTDKMVLGRVFVDDVNGNYIYQQKLKIFSNAAFKYTEKIAPGVSNSYHFVVHNSTNAKLKYFIQMYEDGEYFINLKYRLKRNNDFVIGNDNQWVTANELKTEFSKINMSSSDSYSLDWKWEYDGGVDDLDTLAGKSMESLYKLNIRFYFEEVVAL